MTTTLGGQQSGSIWDLSLYEVHRKPHEVVTDDSLIGVSPRALHSELMCPICLDLMKNAQTTKECLHRFCQECIITALRSGNKECPTCRKKLVSKRSLRSDPNFDALIAKIYPNRDELTQQQEKFRPPHPPLHQLARRKRGNDTQADVPVSSESPSPDEKKPKLYPEEDLSDLDPEDNGSKGDDEEEEESRIEFQLRPHPCDESVSGFDIRTLATSPDATVAHLVKFLGLIQNPTGNTGEKMQTSLDKFSISTSCSSDEGSYVTLEGTTSLKEICDNHWTPGEKMKLYYSANSYSS